jgi:hypothetical protein
LPAPPPAAVLASIGLDGYNTLPIILKDLMRQK